MSEPYDIVAVNDRGVYALISEEASAWEVNDFIDQAHAKGHTTERLPRGEACDRHKVYLATLPEFRSLI
jgi:hypothetical protein